MAFFIRVGAVLYRAAGLGCCPFDNGNPGLDDDVPALNAGCDGVGFWIILGFFILLDERGSCDVLVDDETM